MIKSYMKSQVTLREMEDNLNGKIKVERIEEDEGDGLDLKIDLTKNI